MENKRVVALFTEKEYEQLEVISRLWGLTPSLYLNWVGKQEIERYYGVKGKERKNKKELW